MTRRCVKFGIGATVTLLYCMCIAEAFGQAAPGPTTPAATAAAAGATNAAGNVTASSPTFGVMQGVLGLALVVALIYATGWVLKKVGPRERVVLVQFSDQVLLLGVAPGQVALLQTIAADRFGADVTNAQSIDAAPSFVERLKSARKAR